MGYLSKYNDTELDLLIAENFGNDSVIGGLDTQSLYVLLMDLKGTCEGTQTASFDMERVEE